MAKPQPKCIVIAGPNGAGKTTFARDFLPKELGILHFVNADLIATGLSPLQPELATHAAGRLMLSEFDRLSKQRISFAFESTLSGVTYIERMKKLRNKGYSIEIAFLQLSSSALAIKRVAHRVKQGGHNVPEKDIIRRYKRGWNNFVQHYRPLADRWSVYDNSGSSPKLVEAYP